MILDIQQIQTQIRRIAKTGVVALSKHCKARMPERNVDFLDIIMSSIGGKWFTTRMSILI